MGMAEFGGLAGGEGAKFAGAALDDLAGELLREGGSARAGALGVRKDVQVGERARCDEVECGGVIGIGFAGEARDDVRADGGVREMLVDEFDAAGIVFGAIPAMHGGEDAVGSGLQGHVEVGSDAAVGGEKFDEVLRYVEGFDGADAKAFDGGFAEDAAEEIEKFDARREIAAISAEIDAAEDNFAEAGIGKALEFGEDGLRGQAAGLAADKGDDAEGTAGVAAVLDFQRGARVIPFPAEDRGDKDFGELGDVAGENRGGKDGLAILRGSSGGSRSSVGTSLLRPYKGNLGGEIWGDEGDRMEQGGDLGFVGVADDIGDAGERGKFFGGALGVTASDNDARRGIGGVKLADGVASLRISGGGDGAGVEHDDIGRGRVGGEGEAAIAELALDGRAVGLRGTAAELFDEESAHG